MNKENRGKVPLALNSERLITGISAEVEGSGDRHNDGIIDDDCCCCCCWEIREASATSDGENEDDPGAGEENGVEGSENVEL